MKKSNYNMNKLRQSYILRVISIGILWIAAIGTIPQTSTETTSDISPIQRILPSDRLPAISASTISKTTPTSAEFSFVLLNGEFLQKHFHIYTILEHCSTDHAQALAHFLLNAQITSSFL